MPQKITEIGLDKHLKREIILYKNEPGVIIGEIKGHLTLEQTGKIIHGLEAAVIEKSPYHHGMHTVRNIHNIETQGEDKISIQNIKSKSKNQGKEFSFEVNRVYFLKDNDLIKIGNRHYKVNLRGYCYASHLQISK